jgi:DNA-directed RNA polymerase specialized sigma24 family protein
MPCSILMPSACSVPSGPAGVADTGDPASHAEMADSLSLAFLVLLETLSPEQRAAFLLREVFDYPYDQTAAIVATSELNAR